MTTLVDRSRIISYQSCPRMRWLQYHRDGTGLVPLRLNIPLTVGGCVHEGLEDLLSGKGVEEAVKRAVGKYWAEVRLRGIQSESGDDEDIVAKEQAALIEGMLRGYEKVQLPKLLAEYEVLEVEKEESFQLADDIVLMARADALLLERESGDLYIQSFKTAASWDSRTDKSAQFDMQGLSEMAAVEGRLGMRWVELKVDDNPPAAKGRVDEYLLGIPNPPKVMGIRYEYLLKGDRYKDEKSGRWLSHSPLIRGYVKQGVTMSDTEFAWKSRVPCPGAGHMVMGAKGEYPCKGQQYHTLGKDFNLFNVWDGINVSGGVKTWIDLLMTGSVQPELIENGVHPIESQFVVPPPYFRNDSDVREWKESVAHQEKRVASAVEMVNAAEGDERLHVLNREFPRHLSRCAYPTVCPYAAIGGSMGICYSDAVNADPVGVGMYTARVPHHQEELKARGGE